MKIVQRCIMNYGSESWSSSRLCSRSRIIYWFGTWGRSWSNLILCSLSTSKTWPESRSWFNFWSSSSSWLDSDFFEDF
jgi:hypothetical protein